MSARVERDLQQLMLHRAWPLPWRVGKLDVEVCYLKLVTEGEADFAGSTYKMIDGKVWEVHYDFNAWRRWLGEQLATVNWTIELPKCSEAVFDMGRLFSREEWTGWFEADRRGVRWDLYLLRLQMERNAVAWVNSSSNAVSTSSGNLLLEFDAEIQAAIERYAVEQDRTLEWDGKRWLCDER